MEYNFKNIEQKWQAHWKATEAYKVSNHSIKPKYYVLDMFPYPSGAGLHVGHPLGYIASDIYSRYKRLKGYNVLHPMGFDSFGLPAEQYALETGQHPATTTEKNIANFKQQLDKIGFCYDWSREVRTSDPAYYKWTQKIFLDLFNSYFCTISNKAKPIAELVAQYQHIGSAAFSAAQWKSYNSAEQANILMASRLAYSAFGEVNWCQALGTVLANDEVVNGLSERGGHPVVKKKMRQWYLRITAYADRLLQGLATVDFSEPMKEMQRNWIGRSEGAEIQFVLTQQQQPNATPTNKHINCYTTRPDTIFGVDFLVLAPEHSLVNEIITVAQQPEVNTYLTYVKSRSDRERMTEVKQITGCFTGAYATNPLSNKPIPVWIAEYVLAGYGTGAIMAVPCGDQRDFAFATHFGIPITNIIGQSFSGSEANPTKQATLHNSGFLNGYSMQEAIGIAIDKIETTGVGKRKVNYRMRDAGFSRQRYWGEPFPIVWHKEQAIALTENDLPLTLPHAAQYSPGPEGEGPLANLSDWVNLPYWPSVAATQADAQNDTKAAQITEPNTLAKRETSTMPGYAGSSWYFLRYMDPHNTHTFCNRQASDYWQQVDVYIGGTEHAVGHLLYSRMWTKILHDLNYIGFDEPYKKLVNQGMIQGVSDMLYRYKNDNDESNTALYWTQLPIAITNSQGLASHSLIASNNCKEIYYSADFVKQHNINLNLLTPIHVPITCVEQTVLDIDKLITENDNYQQAVFVVSDKYWHNNNWYNAEGKQTTPGKFRTYTQVEKMSKRYMNTVNPDELCEQYGADTFRMYEMFLGPVEQSKPWDTKGIEGVHRFLKKLWRLFYADPTPAQRVVGEPGAMHWVDEEPTAVEYKILHKTIKKIEHDTANFAYNTAVAAFMIAVNELADAKCFKKEILSQLLILLTPYAPHIAEELWQTLGAQQSILDAAYPIFNEAYLAEATKEYPVSINGKTRSAVMLAIEATEADALLAVQNDFTTQKWLNDAPIKKFIFVKNRMINVVT